LFEFSLGVEIEKTKRCIHMEDWEKKDELIHCLEADDDEYESTDLMLMLGYADAILEEAEI